MKTIIGSSLKGNNTSLPVCEEIIVDLQTQKVLLKIVE